MESLTKKTTALVKQLRDTSALTYQYFDLPESDLERTYAPGKWNIRFLLHHLTDAETVMYDRIRRIIANPGQVCWAFDQNAWAEALCYEELPLSLNREIYQSVRNSVIYLAEYHYEHHGSHTWIHSQTGFRTLQDEFDKIAWHNHHHLDQIRRALSKSSTLTQ